MLKKDSEKTILEPRSLTADIPKQQNSGKLLLTTAVIGLFFGILGAFLGDSVLLPLYKGVNNSGSVTEIKNIQVNEQSAVVDVVKRASPAVVSIIISKDLNKIPGFSSSPFDFGPFSFDPFFRSRNQTDTTEPNIQEVGGGSGFIITADGLIVTNKHVVEDVNAKYTVLTNDGKKYDAKVLSRDPVNDIALVKIEANDLSTLVLGDSSRLELGQKVIAIGNSLGQYRNTVTTGVVSGIGRTITASGLQTGAEQLEGVIQTDAAINPGNSGGPLLDIGGSVIGMNTAIDAQGQLIGFAIPINDVKKDVEDFKRVGKIVKPFLGVRYVLVNEAIKEETKLNVDYGALIVAGGANAPAVIPGSAAEKAGFSAGDVILEINGTKVDRDHSLAGMLKNYNPGDVVKMKVLTGGSETKEIAVTLGEAK